MIFRYPDDPCRIPFSELEYYEKQGNWLCQPKWDGWRRPGYLESKGGKWEFHSKYEKGEQTTEPPAGLVAEFASLGFPDGTAFDMEWMGPRVIDALRGRHFFVLLDLLYWNGQWQGDVQCRHRYENMRTLAALHKARQKVPTPNVMVVDSVDSGFVEMYRDQMRNPLTEGVVIKHGISTLLGNFRRPVDNPLWKKAKYRE